MSKLANVEHRPGMVTWFCPGCLCGHSAWVSGSYTPKWSFNGDYDKPTLSPSVLYNRGGKVCHCYIHDGKIQFLSDSTHMLAGKTVPMEDA